MWDPPDANKGDLIESFQGIPAHWFGWMGFLVFAGSASYSALKRGFPRNIKTWLLIHCVTGTLSLILVAFHIINKIQAPRPGYFISFFAFFLMAVIVMGYSRAICKGQNN